MSRSGRPSWRRGRSIAPSVRSADSGFRTCVPNHSVQVSAQLVRVSDPETSIATIRCSGGPHMATKFGET